MPAVAPVQQQQTRLTMGNFTVYPGYATVGPGQVQQVSVDCIIENLGKSEELLAIDIHDRDPTDHPSGIPYRLFAEGCVPQINTSPESVFEEHQIVHTLAHFNPTSSGFNGIDESRHQENYLAIYGINENRLLIPSALVGKKTKVRFKIQNNNKVQSDVVFNLKSMSSKLANKINEIFEIEPPKCQIPAYGHVMATVTFNPPSIGSYQCIFEGFIDGLPQAANVKPKQLSFDILAESSLPQVQVSIDFFSNVFSWEIYRSKASGSCRTRIQGLNAQINPL